MFDFLKDHFFPRVTWARMALNPLKSEFFVRRIPILGLVGGDGIRPSDNKISVMKDYPTPKSYSDVEAFLYLTPFLRRFIPGRAEHARVLKNCMVEDEVTGQVFFVWTDRHQRSFEAIRDAICQNAVYAVDYEVQLHLAADASMRGMGAVLFQLGNGIPPNIKLTPANRKEMRVISFISQKFTSAESKYVNSEREAFAVIKALAECRHLVLGSKFPVMVYTDHSALTTILMGDSARGRIANWQSQIGEYDLRIVHIPGKEMQLADGLSRIPEDAMQESRRLEGDYEDERWGEMKGFDEGEVVLFKQEEKGTRGIKKKIKEKVDKGKKVGSQELEGNGKLEVQQNLVEEGEGGKRRNENWIAMEVMASTVEEREEVQMSDDLEELARRAVQQLGANIRFKIDEEKRRQARQRLHRIEEGMFTNQRKEKEEPEVTLED